MDIEREDGHEVFVSFYMLIAVVRVLHYPGSIGNFSSTRIPVLNRRSVVMNHQNKLRSETDFNFSTIMPITWEGVEIDKVNWIPEGGIDSLKIYELNTTASTSSNNHELLKDGWEWKKDSRSFWKGHGDVHYSDCQGSNRYENLFCEYRSEIQCCICKTPAHHVPCLTRKYVVLRKNSIRVYHFGTHTCCSTTVTKTEREGITAGRLNSTRLRGITNQHH